MKVHDELDPFVREGTSCDKAENDLGDWRTAEIEDAAVRVRVGRFCDHRDRAISWDVELEPAREHSGDWTLDDVRRAHALLGELIERVATWGPPAPCEYHAPEWLEVTHGED